MAKRAVLIALRSTDPKPFLLVMGETLFTAPVYRMYGSAIASGRSPSAPSGLGIALKDVGLALGEAEAGRTRAPGGAPAGDLRRA